MRFEKFGLIMVFASLVAVSAAYGRDVITEQHNVAVAERIMEKAQAEYDADAEQVRLLKERVAQQQAQLAEAEKKVEMSKKNLAQAKEEYNKQQKILEQAWKSK